MRTESEPRELALLVPTNTRSSFAPCCPAPPTPPHSPLTHTTHRPPPPHHGKSLSPLAHSSSSSPPPPAEPLPHPTQVCAKCERKIAKSGTGGVAASDVWNKPGPSSSSSAGTASGRKVGENKLLSSKARYSPYAPTAAASADRKGKGKAGAGAADLAGGSGGAVARCEVCRSVTARPGAKYCQGALMDLSLSLALARWRLTHPVPPLPSCACTAAASVPPRLPPPCRPPGCAYKKGAPSRVLLLAGRVADPLASRPPARPPTRSRPVAPPTRRVRHVRQADPRRQWVQDVVQVRAPPPSSLLPPGPPP